MWTRKAKTEPLTRAQRRVRSLSYQDLLSCIDPTIFSLGRSLSQWQRRHEEYLLHDASEAVQVLQAVVDELKARSEG